MKYSYIGTAVILATLATSVQAAECHWTRRHGSDPYPTPKEVCITYEKEVSSYIRKPATFKTLILTRDTPSTVYKCVFSALGYDPVGFSSWNYEAHRSDKIIPAQSCEPCALRFTAPNNNASFDSANITIFGYGQSSNPSDSGSIILKLNNEPVLNHSGLLKDASAILQSGVPVTLRTGLNILSISGSTSTCNVSDSMTLFFDPQTDLTANKGDPKSCPSPRAGNPINTAIGNKYQQEDDYLKESSFPLVFSRQYNSVDGYWRHNFSTRLAISGSFLTVIDADGHESRFTRNNQIATPSPAELVCRSRNSFLIASSTL